MLQDPRVFEDVLQCDSVRWIFPEQPGHQVPCLTGHVGLAHEELLGEDPEGPMVDQ